MPLHRPPQERVGAKRHPSSEDFANFPTIVLLQRVHRYAVCPMLNASVYRRLRPGERFVTHGDAGDAFFIIPSGSSAILIEKDGECHQIATRREGGIIGEMVLLTGESRSARFDAETDMDVGEMDKDDFVAITWFNHDNIIKVYDVETLYQAMSIVMKLVEDFSNRVEDLGVTLKASEFTGI
ncbi:MAG: cyclic nucleotide-binding domain-containing protein [Desulfobacterales bacterium]